MTRAPRRSKDVVTVAALYATAIIALLIGELLYANTVSRATFAEYSLVRNILPFASAATLVGVDQAITRELAAGRFVYDLKQVFHNRLLCAGGVAAVAAMATLATTGSTAAAGTVALVVPAVVISDLASATLRGRGSYKLSAAVQQGYRLSLGLALAVASALTLSHFSWASESLPFVALAIGAPSIAFLATRQLNLAGVKALATTSHLNRLGFGFGFSMIPFVALDWADQALLARVSNSLSNTGNYALTKLISVYPLLSLASVSGFILMPEIVKRLPHVNASVFRQWITMGAFAVAGLTTLWTVVVTAFLSSALKTQAPIMVTVLLCLVGGLRLFYLIPSSVLGAAGSAGAIMRASLWGLPTLVLLPSSCWFMMEVAGRDAMESVAVGLALATAARVLVATQAAHRSVSMVSHR